MSVTRRVRFEPIGEEIECGAEETVLDAAFRHGYNLVYGCREGQCSACKCFLLEGDAALKRYSNFALSDTERANGYALMCRAMPEEDLVVELLHYDPDNYRLEHTISDGVAVVEAIEALTPDITRLALRADGFEFTPGQYVDLHVDGERRSFSMANVEPGRIELIVKRYPGGRFSGKLDGELQPGDEIGYTGPYGSLRARESERPILMIAGGSGMAPILSLLREFKRQGCTRPIRFFYGARTEEDLFYTDLAAGLADFTPVTGRFVHEVVDEYLTTCGGHPDVYMCGPPPMIEAAEEMLASHGIDDRQIYVDKFTTSAEAAQPAGPPVKTFEAPAPATADESEREFGWYTPAKRRATLYEDVTIDTQPSIHRHLNRGWPVSFEDGRGTWDDASTALRSTDWFAFRDPSEYWERPYYQRESAIEQQIDGAMQSAVEQGLIDDFGPEWIEFLRANLQVPAYVEHGLWFALATIGRACLSDSVATCVCLQAAMKQRSAQALVLYAMDLEQHHGPFPIAAAREAFLQDEAWQPTRRYLERLAASTDWGEVIVAANLCFEPIVGTLLRRELGIRAAAANGDTVTPVLARVATQEWEWAQAWSTELVRFLSADPDHGADNRALIDQWVAEWQPLANEAALALAPLAEEIPRGIEPGSAVQRIQAYAERVHAQTSVSTASEAGVAGRAGGAVTRPARRRTRPSNVKPASAATIDDGSFDYVGIVMAKSAEGDAVAEILGRRAGIEVLEQPAFWDIRSRGRLEIPYEEVSEQLGYEVDAYSIQHEMSTHYGRMVATDDALMLFSDPTEAMQYLMA